MQKNNNIVTIVLVIAVVVLIGVLISKNSTKTAELSGSTQVAGPQTVYCQDTDNGLTLATKGTASTYTMTNNGSKKITSSSADSCSNASTVTEYYCGSSAGNGYITSTASTCGTSGGCVNGACVGGDITAPAVPSLSITNSDKSFVTGNANDIHAFVSDNIAVTKVTFFNDGKMLNCPITNLGQINTGVDNYSITSCDYGPTNLGTHTLSAVACDAAGLCTTGTKTVEYLDCAADPSKCSSTSF